MTVGASELLTTLDRVKTWLAIPQDNKDADDFLVALIRSASAFVLNCLNRDSLALTETSEIYDGYGNTFMVLRRAPVYDVTALSFGGTPIPAATGDGFNQPYTGGWLWDNRRLSLYGMAFPRCRGGIAVRYRAGYVTTEDATVPSTVVSPATALMVSTNHKWLEGVSVSLTDGTALLEVDGVPAAGEYSVADGTYTFNAAQAGVVVQILYSYVPSDIEQAVWEMVGERYKYRDRIGMNSKSLGGQETVSFSQSAMPMYIRELLQPYERVVPVA